MASAAAIAVRRAEATEALDKAKQKLSAVSGVKLDADAPVPKDADIARIVFIEETTRLLDKVVRKLELAKAPPAKPKK